MRITPITGIDAFARFDALCALDVISFVQDYFPNNQIQQHHSFTFDHTDPFWMDKALKIHNGEINDPMNERALKPEGTSKNLQMKRGIDNVCIEQKVDLLLMATTANPPDEDMISLGFFDKAETKRNEPHNRSVLRNQLYVPYINANKKFVAGIYKHYDLMDSLYLLTSSCVGMPLDTNFGENECGKCFWCFEKQWGFADEG